MATPSQRQIIPLQSRPYENDDVSGSLTVEVGILQSLAVNRHFSEICVWHKSMIMTSQYVLKPVFASSFLCYVLKCEMPPYYIFSYFSDMAQDDKAELI